MENLTPPPLRRWLYVLASLAGFSALFGFTMMSGPSPEPKDHRSAALPVMFHFDCIDGEPGDTVCIPVRVEDFTDIVIAQFEIIWNSTVLDYINIQNPGAPGINVLADFNLSGPNALKFIPLGFPIDGQSLPDGTVLFEICFRIIGTPGSTSPIGISPYFDFEVADVTGVIESDFTPCTLTVNDAVNLVGFLTSCGPAMPGDNGTIDITVYGGSAPYTITWLETGSGTPGGPVNIPAEGGSTVLNVPPGVYDITLTDGAGGSIVYSLEVDPVGLDVVSIVKQPTCYRFSNGTITLKPSGGSFPISYIWSSMTASNLAGSGFIRNPGDSSVITSLPDGIYTILLRDDNGCEVTIMDTLVDNPFVFNVMDLQDATCNGSEDGFIDLQISGATPDVNGDYTIVVRPGFQVNSNSIAIGLLDPGEYCITVSDAVSQCDTVFCFDIGYSDTITASVTPTDPTCFGGTDGRVTVRGRTNGVTGPTYTYSIFENGILLTTQANVGGNFNYSPLDPGTYAVVVAEGACVSDSIYFTITEPPPIEVSLVGTNPDNCIPTPRGDAWFSINGAAAPYILDAGAGFQDADTIFDLNAGNYVLTVTDANMCTATLAFVVEDYAANDEADITFVFTGTPCDGGTVTVLYQGNPIPPGAGVSWSTNEITPTITITETDTLGVTILLGAPIFCILSDTVHIRCEDILMLDITVEQPVCGQGADGGPYTGTVIVDTTNAVAPVTWTWSFGETTSSGIYTGLEPGRYYVTVTDGLDSTAVDSFDIIAPPTLQLTASMITGTSCPEACDGSVRIQPGGGDPTMDYVLYWEEMGQPATDTGVIFNIADLCSGEVVFIVSQDGICFFRDTILIPEPDPVTINLVDAMDVTCYGLSDGSLEVSAAGGSPNYTFVWDDNTPGPLHTNLGAGEYFVTVTDINGCMAVDSFIIVQPDSLSVVVDSSATLLLSCGGSSDGVITVEASGGNPGGYTYTWNPDVSNSFQAVNLGIGTYSVTATDPLGCADTTSFTLTAPAPILVEWPLVADPACFGDETVIMLGQVSGGSGNYSFNINGGPLFDITEPQLVPSGIYIVSVFDDRGCSADTMYTIMEPNPILVSIGPEDPVIDLGDSLFLTGIIDQSDNPIALYAWTSTDPVSCPDCEGTWVFNAQPTTYTWTVTDVNGCQGSTSILVNVDFDRDVYIPNVFSPNNDGRNDDFRVFTGLGVVSVDRFEIYDRWGNQLHAENNLSPSPTGTGNWDGTSRGKPLNPGVYVYVIQVRFIDNNTTLTYRGDVTLLR